MYFNRPLLTLPESQLNPNNFPSVTQAWKRWRTEKMQELASDETNPNRLYLANALKFLMARTRYSKGATIYFQNNEVVLLQHPDVPEEVTEVWSRVAEQIRNSIKPQERITESKRAELLQQLRQVSEHEAIAIFEKMKPIIPELTYNLVVMHHRLIHELAVVVWKYIDKIHLKNTSPS